MRNEWKGRKSFRRMKKATSTEVALYLVDLNLSILIIKSESQIDLLIGISYLFS